jgi:hypothetical protein
MLQKPAALGNKTVTVAAYVVIDGTTIVNR